MIVVDANLLLYAYDESAQPHDQARKWFERLLSGHELIGIPWVVILAFLQISTNIRITEAPLTAAEATAIVSSWLSQDDVRILAPDEQHWQILQKLMIDAQVRGPLVTDTHIAALTIERGATLCTNDSNFKRFPGLNLVYPLQTS